MFSHFQAITAYFRNVLTTLPPPTITAIPTWAGIQAPPSGGQTGLAGGAAGALTFIQGHIERAIEGTRSTLTYPLLHLHPISMQAIDNQAGYYSKRITGTFTVWVLGNTDDYTSQDNAWAISEIWSDAILQKMNHDCKNGFFENFSILAETTSYEQIRPLWADRSHGWEVTFQLDITANDNLC